MAHCKAAPPRTLSWAPMRAIFILVITAVQANAAFTAVQANAAAPRSHATPPDITQGVRRVVRRFGRSVAVTIKSRRAGGASSRQRAARRGAGGRRTEARWAAAGTRMSPGAGASLTGQLKCCIGHSKGNGTHKIYVPPCLGDPNTIHGDPKIIFDFGDKVVRSCDKDFLNDAMTIFLCDVDGSAAHFSAPQEGSNGRDEWISVRKAFKEELYDDVKGREAHKYWWWNRATMRTYSVRKGKISEEKELLKKQKAIREGYYPDKQQRPPSLNSIRDIFYSLEGFGKSKEDFKTIVELAKTIVELAK